MIVNARIPAIVTVTVKPVKSITAKTGQGLIAVLNLVKMGKSKEYNLCI